MLNNSRTCSTVRHYALYNYCMDDLNLNNLIVKSFSQFPATLWYLANVRNAYHYATATTEWVVWRHQPVSTFKPLHLQRWWQSSNNTTQCYAHVLHRKSNNFLTWPWWVVVVRCWLSLFVGLFVCFAELTRASNPTSVVGGRQVLYQEIIKKKEASCESFPLLSESMQQVCLFHKFGKHHATSSFSSLVVVVIVVSWPTPYPSEFATMSYAGHTFNQLLPITADYVANNRYHRTHHRCQKQASAHQQSDTICKHLTYISKNKRGRKREQILSIDRKQHAYYDI